LLTLQREDSLNAFNHQKFISFSDLSFLTLLERHLIWVIIHARKMIDTFLFNFYHLSCWFMMSFIKKQIDKEIKEQWLIAWNDSIKKENQYQKHTARMNLSYKSLKKLRKIDRLTFSTFIQLKMKHDYFKSYLHRLSENNLNKCYEICKARQTLKHLLLNCKHYKTEQLQLKAKAQFKNMNTILTLFIIKIERIATLKYLKSTWIATRKWLLRTKE